VKLVEGTGCSIADTRKTLPGLRALQKYAVCCGGGKNHRFNLSDAAMLKDNHIDAGGGIRKTVALLRAHVGHTVKIEVETRDLDEVREALEAGADIIMLDNMDVPTMREAVRIIDKKALTEASGNITLENIREKAQSGVDIISMGSLTHSVKAFDISMKID
jgi:nicotinate-nucleotide pyrophosphorylase (carboxylating)